MDGGNADLRTAHARDPHHQLRVRAAWLYYVDGLTQADVAGVLGVNRVMVTRLLSDARTRGEVVIRIRSDISALLDLQGGLESRYGLKRAIVVPSAGEGADPTRAIAAAAGAYVSEIVSANMTVGVGWGRTLHAMLPFVEGRAVKDLRVVSLLGGIAQPRRFNPAEFAWQFAELFGAEGYLVPAPAIVDSADTKAALLERCGLERVFRLAETCEMALVSCGDIGSLTTSYRVGHVSEAERRSLIEAGAVGDLLYNFIDAEGRPVSHPVNDRAISLPVDRLGRIGERVLVSGGVAKTEILRATMKAIRPTTFITDEQAALRLLQAPAS